eukprot:1449989-Prymnesium_polylepis.1
MKSSRYNHEWSSVRRAAWSAPPPEPACAALVSHRPCLPAQPSDTHAPSPRRCVVHVLPLSQALAG